MSLKINILSLLGALLIVPSIFAGEKFLRVQGELFDGSTNTSISDFKVRIVEDDMDSSTIHFEKSSFDLWIQPNHVTKIYFIKEGYVIDHMLVDASFIPSRAYKKKQKIEDLSIKMYQASNGTKRTKKPILIAEYVANINGFEVKDMRVKKATSIPKDYKAPFPSPADTYKHVKPTSKSLGLTENFNTTKSKGKSGIARVIQGILFADMSYCFFNERTNDANIYLEYLRQADNESWGAIKDFDSPEYGKIICRTVNREQSVDTLFALGAHLETSRLIFQDFTSDSKVLIHLKTLKTVLYAFKPKFSDPQLKTFISGLNSMLPHIDTLDADYKQKLRDKLNFEMQEDEAFKAIQSKTEELYKAIIQ